jgi:hypothetical protein
MRSKEDDESNNAFIPCLGAGVNWFPLAAPSSRENDE